MTLREKIECMQAFERGEEIEETYTHQKEKEWLPNKNPSWDWCRCIYRIKSKPKQVVVIEKWLCKSRSEQEGENNKRENNMNNQRLRNLTTSRLHTCIGDVYEDIKFLTGVSVMTHQIPEMLKLLQPYLKNKLADARFFDGEFDLSHIGDTDIEPMSDGEEALYLGGKR
jgi:hypothetical protein